MSKSHMKLKRTRYSAINQLVSLDARCASNCLLHSRALLCSPTVLFSQTYEMTLYKLPKRMEILGARTLAVHSSTLLFLTHSVTSAPQLMAASVLLLCLYHTKSTHTTNAMLTNAHQCSPMLLFSSEQASAGTGGSSSLHISEHCHRHEHVLPVHTPAFF